MTKTMLGGLRSLFNSAPVPFVSKSTSPLGLSAGYLKNDAVGQMEAMGGNGTLFSIVNRTSTSTAAVRWRLYRSAASGLDEDRTEITKHQALKVWKRPNNFFTGTLFVETFQQHVDLVGEGWWVLGRSSGLTFPTEMWPVRPDRIRPVPSYENYLVGYIYRSPDGEEVPLQLNEVIQLRMPNPLDPYRGMGPVQTILMDLDSDRYSAEWNRNFFINSAEPGGVIEVDRHLTDGEFDEMTSRWNESHRGVTRAHRIAVLEHGKYVPRAFSQRDMQFAELRGLSQDVIRGAFGIPKFAVGDLEDVNRATAEASKAWFSEQMTVPRLERIKDALNFQFLPTFGSTGKGVEFDYDNPVPPNVDEENKTLKAKTDAYKTLLDAGVDPDDAADYVGIPRMRVTPKTATTPTPVLEGAAA